MNNTDAITADIKNAHIQDPSFEKHYIIFGPEFVLENAGKVAPINRSIYGGKSSREYLWKNLRICMTHIGFESLKKRPRHLGETGTEG